MYTFCNIVKDSIILYEFDKRRSLVEVLHRDSEGVVRKERKKKETMDQWNNMDDDMGQRVKIF